MVYRIHEQNSLKIRRARFGETEKKKKQSLLQRAAAAAGITVLAGPLFGATACAEKPEAPATKDPGAEKADAAKEKAPAAPAKPARPILPIPEEGTGLHQLEVPLGAWSGIEQRMKSVPTWGTAPS